MKSLPIPESEQIEAMLNGSFLQLLDNYTKRPEHADFRKFITVTRQKLIEYLNQNPSKAKVCFQRQVEVNVVAANDVASIWEEKGKYFVAWMDHGRTRNPRHFNTLAEAVAELVLVNHGMY